MREEPNLLIVISGPSGVGKDAVLAGLRRLERPFHFVVTMTTRGQRDGEEDGVHYRFVSRGQFQEMRDTDELLECAQVYGNWYGVPKGGVRQGLELGRDVVVKVDVQGAATIRRLVPQACLVFVAPPSMDELQARLKQRNSEAGVDLRRRVETADAEMEQLPLFDYVVVNDEVDCAVEKVNAIITAEKCRVVPRLVEL